MFLIKVLENGEFRYLRNNLAHQNKTGILLEQIMNKSPQELLGKEIGDNVTRNYRKCVVRSKSITYEEELSLLGGNYIWLTTLTPIIERDKVLITVGNRLSKSIRKSDVVARMGGDEFTIIIRNIQDKKCVDAFVKKIHTMLQEVMNINSIECKVNSSIGVAIYPENGEYTETLLRNADSLMYEIKRNGKGGFKLPNKVE
jgi:hypothetical protein